MNLTPQDVSREVTSTGFGGEPLEKVFRLMALLDALNSHPFFEDPGRPEGRHGAQPVPLRRTAPVDGHSGNLELDVNFMLPTPLWPPRIAECHPVGSFKTAPATVLDPHELAAGNVAAWLDKLVAECRERLAIVLPLRAHELEFLERLNGAGDIAPEVLSDDAAMQATIRDHPGLQWKALNVRKRLGVAASDGEAVE